VRDPEGVGHPKRGAGHIALDTGAPLIPCAITGTEALFAGPFPKPRRVQVRSPSRSRWVCCRRARRVRAS
jgi:1-acyl-sn-glycerol-3-phosphate acyltransferase